MSLSNQIVIEIFSIEYDVSQIMFLCTYIVSAAIKLTSSSSLILGGT